MIDIDLMAAQLGFEPDEAAMLVEMFLESAQSTLSQLQSAIEREDYEAIRSHAHSIKGSAANLTLEAIYLHARNIEESARAEAAIDYAAEARKLADMIAEITIPEVL